MWLDELVELAQTLRQRIADHGDLLRANETRTRYALVDPLLIALGWDVHNPDQVVTEYSAGTGRADYALRGGSDETPDLLIEAKKLDTPLVDKLGQAITYCNERGIKHFAVTDGARWAIYETFKPVPNAQKLITEFSLNSPENEFVFKLMWLWRGNFLTGEPVSPPIRPDQEANGPEPPVDGEDAEWISLSSLKVEPRQPPPKSMKFPDGTTRSISTWRDVQRRVVEWASATGRLTPDKCPITGPKGRIIVNSRNVQKNDKPFDTPAQIGDLDLWWEKFRGAPGHYQAATLVLEAVGVDPATVFVKLGG